MNKPLFLMVMILALVVGAGGGTHPAYANDGPTGVTWYANSPAGVLPNGRQHGHGP